MENRKAILQAADKVGGIVKLSLALGLSRGAASQWRRVPAERVLEVERLTGVPKEILRPDLYHVQQSYTEPQSRGLRQ